jgi:protoheme IX farnesyltransferase
MKALSPALAMPASASRSRMADYAELAKLKVGVLVLFTVAAGAWLAARGMPQPALLFHVLLGTGFVVAGASALNQLLERRTDALMARTADRPLPAGRLQPLEVAVFGLVLGMGGVVYLALAAPQPTAAIVAALAFVSYVFVYTPLKRVTTLNTLVGAAPGALPPVIGWTAVTGTVDLPAGVLFLTVYLWQVPHFLAIAWIYRDDYARAKLLMLPVIDVRGAMTARQMVAYCIALIPVTLLPALWGLAGPVYVLGALVLGLGFLRYALGFRSAADDDHARRVLRASLVYLPALLVLLLAEGAAEQAAYAIWP